MRKTISFDAAAVEVAFQVDKASRTLTGVLLPFGEVSRPARDPQTGMVAKFKFSEGTVTLPDPGEVVLNYGHDRESLLAQVGVATSLSPEKAGVVAQFKIARTPEGDRVLALAEDKILRAFSAEVEGVFEADADGVQVAKQTSLTGAAVVPKPAFLGAQITSVAASAASTERNTTMKCTTCGVVHAADVTTCDPQAVATFQAASAAPTFSATDGQALMAQVQTLSEKIAALEDIKIPVGPGTAQFQVNEEPIYRLSGTVGAPSGFDFATDLLAAANRGDLAALKRIQDFTAQRLGPQFADQPTSTGDVAAINPSQYRPDLFLGQAPVPASPLYDFFYKGGLSNVTPFFYSKLDRSATDVGVADHTEGTDPESRDIVTAAGATVTPVPVSGRVHINREVGDQGGNPQVSGLVWSEFDRSFKVALETKTAALVLASSMSELGGSITAGETDGAVIGGIVEAGLVGLQFLADGFRFQRAFGHIDLYKALAAATKGTDNADKLYPIVNPQSTSGQAASKWSYIDIGGYGMYPAASLGATNTNQKSVVADPLAVHVWNSGLQRLERLQETVEGWDLGVFAYWAGVVYDVTGLRKITYDVTA